MFKKSNNHPLYQQKWLEYLLTFVLLSLFIVGVGIYKKVDSLNEQASSGQPVPILPAAGTPEAVNIVTETEISNEMSEESALDDAELETQQATSDATILQGGLFDEATL
jgi:hypothetical protein